MSVGDEYRMKMAQKFASKEEEQAAREAAKLKKLEGEQGGV
jgi:hypothetical protein